MGINNERIVNRRQLLVKVGSLMKLSWKKSKEEEESELSNHSRRGQRKRERICLVSFDDEVLTIPDKFNGPLSDDEIKERWYQENDYCRFKKDTILNSLNYINARRASKPFDETNNCIRGIEEMCSDPKIRQRYTAEKKYLFKVIREEQNRQKKEEQQKRKQRQQSEIIDRTRGGSSPSYPDLERFRSISIVQTKASRDRAITKGNEYARFEQQRRRSKGSSRSRSPSMKGLFRTKSEKAKRV